MAWLAVIAMLIAVRFWDYWSLQLRGGLSPLAWLVIGAALYAAILVSVVVQRRGIARTVDAA